MNTLFKTMKKRHLIWLFLLTACVNMPTDTAQQDIYQGIEFDMPKVIEPIFPDYSISILEFGAVSDGQTVNTEAITKAINKVADNGGGMVIIPRGLWLTGPITLESNVNLHLEAGALLQFSTNKDLYPLIETSYEGRNAIRCTSPINGKELENIAITGEGIIDGSGDAWRPVKRGKMTDRQWNKLVNSGGFVIDNGNLWVPSESYRKGMEERDLKLETIEDYEVIKDIFRPVMISLVKCKNVLLDGPVFQNSPAWNIHPLMCEDITVRNIEVRNPWYSQNGDGIDFESCKNAVLYDSKFDVGDDAICIKSGKNKDGRDRGMPAENTIVKNCVVYHGHGGVTVGSEMSGGVKNLHVSGCTFIGTDVGLRFKTNRNRGGVVEKIFISDIDMVHIPTNAISFNMYYGGKSVSEMLESEDNKKGEEIIPPVTEKTPQFKDITIKNVTCSGAYQAIYLQGLPEMNLENVLLENLHMSATNGLTCMDAKDISIKNLHLITENYPAVLLYNAKNMTIDGISLPETTNPLIEVRGSGTENIAINPTMKIRDSQVMVDELVNDNAVKLNL